MKLRFAFFFIVLIAANTIATAQKGLSFTIYGMPQRTFMYSKPEENFESKRIQRKPSYNFAFGFLFNSSLTKKINISYGLQYAPNEQKYQDTSYRNAVINNGVRLKYFFLLGRN